MSKGFITTTILIVIAAISSGALGTWIYLDGHNEFQGGAPVANNLRNVLPITDLTYELGTSTANWLRLYTGGLTFSTTTSGCLESTSSGLVFITGTACGTGSGGVTVFGDLADVATSSDATGDIWYLNASGQLTNLNAGSNGQVLKLAAGIPSWGTDNAGAGGTGLWATTTDSLVTYPTDTSDVIVIGDNATSTLGNILEVIGNSLFRGAATTTGKLSSYAFVEAPYFNATSTTDSSTLTGGFLSQASSTIAADLQVTGTTTSQMFVAEPEGSQTNLVATDTINPQGFSHMQIDSGADIVLTSIPNIASTTQGHLLFLHNNGTTTISVQDGADLGGSNVILNGADSTIKVGSIMTLLFDVGGWTVVSNPNSSVAGANADTLSVRNESGSSIAAGKAVYISGYNNGQNRELIDLADADDPNKIPAIGITSAVIPDGANGDIVTSGSLVNVLDTSSASINQGVWLDTTPGEVVFTRPNTDEVQRLGTVARSHATLGVLVVTGAGRTNDGKNNATTTTDFSGDLMSNIFSVGQTATSTFDTAGVLTLSSALAVTSGGTGATTLNDLITLTTHTTGNYVATLADAGNTEITVTNGTAEGGAATVDIIGASGSDWTGTFDGQEGSYYLDATNLTNFGNPFYTFFNATTTDALTEGSSNLYNQTHTGEVTGATALTIASGVVDSDNIINNTIVANDISTTTTFLDGEYLKYVAATDNFTSVTCAEITGSADLCDGSDDGAGGTAFAWTTETWGVSTSTTLGFGQGFISQASSTFTAAPTLSTLQSTILTTDQTGLVVASSTIDEAYLDTDVILSTEIDTYSELNTIVADQTLTHNGLIDTFSELDTIVADKNLCNLDDAQTFAALQEFNGNASTTALSVYNNAYFGATATSTFDSAGVLTIAGSGTWDSGGVDIAASESYAVAGTDILADSAGTLTLSNVDALDATTETTIEAAIDTLSNLTTTGALNSGSITSGFGNIDIGSSNFDADGTITSTGNVDFSGASFLKIPSAADPTIDVADKISIDTTQASTSIKYHDGTAERTLSPFGFGGLPFASSTLAYSGAYSTTGTTTILLANPPRKLTLTEFYIKLQGGTSANVCFGDGTASTTCGIGTTSGLLVTLSANNSWTRFENLYIEIGTQVGDPDIITVTPAIRKDE